MIFTTCSFHVIYLYETAMQCDIRHRYWLRKQKHEKKGNRSIHYLKLHKMNQIITSSRLLFSLLLFLTWSNQTKKATLVQLQRHSLLLHKFITLIQKTKFKLKCFQDYISTCEVVVHVIQSLSFILTNKTSSGLIS